MIKDWFIDVADKYLSKTASDNECKLVEEYLTRLEGNNDTTLDNEQEQKLKEAIWQQIKLKTTEQPPQLTQMSWYRRKTIRQIAVAASIILIIGLGIVLFTNNKPHVPSVSVKNNNRTDSITFVHHEINTTGKDKRIQLSDGSLIVLANKSEITYREPFVDRRDITLIGKAFFEVAKDKTKPFTVFSGAISTTALGTQFRVTAFEKANQITVCLYEGKVVVRAINRVDKKLKKEVYLLPGQAFVYGGNSTGKKFKVKNDAPEANINGELFSDSPSIPPDIKGSWYMFNNQPLVQVLDQLSAMFNVQIVYEPKDIENIYFTGKYNRSDSLEDILKRIGIINNLMITKKDNAFIINHK